MVMSVNRLKKWFCFLTVLFAAALFLPKESSAAVVNMKYDAGNDCWIANFIVSSSGDLYLKLTAPFSGLLYVDGSLNDDAGWENAYIRMVKKSGKRIDRFRSNRINDVTGFREAYGVTTGTYYLKLKAVIGRHYWIRAKFVKICADYGGHTKGEAYRLTAGKARTGVISVMKTRQYRWFKFHLTRNAPAKVKVKVNGGQGTIRFYVKGPGLGGTVVKRLSVGAYGPVSRSVRVRKAGWYYVLVTKDPNTKNKRSSGQFSILWKYL